MKLIMTIFSPPKQPSTTITEISGLDAIKSLNGDGISRFVKAELILRGYSYFNRSDDRMVKLQVKR